MVWDPPCGDLGGDLRVCAEVCAGFDWTCGDFRVCVGRTTHCTLRTCVVNPCGDLCGDPRVYAEVCAEVNWTYGDLWIYAGS